MTAKNSPLVTLCAVGDVMLGDHPVCFGHGVRSSVDRIGIDTLFAGVTSAFQGADIVTGNLEATLSYHGLIAGKLESEEMRGRPEFAAGLRRAGFNVMTLANNHALHHGEGAFLDSCKLLAQSGIEAVGVSTPEGLSNCWSYERDGITVGVIGYSVRPEKYRPGGNVYAHGDGGKLVEHVRRLASRYSALVVSIHWGEEYLHTPSPLQVDLGHRLIDAGAGLVLGHHPHVLQGLEKYKQGWIAYSLGNFAFDHWEDSGRESMVLRCGISQRGVENAEVVPVWIGKGFRPEVAAGQQAEHLKRKIQELSQRVDEYADPKHLESYQEMAEQAYQRYRMDSYRYFLLRLWKYHPSIIHQSLTRALRRRAS